MKKSTILNVFMIMLVITLTFSTLVSNVKAADVKITSITPSNKRGNVGTVVHIIGTINTTDGRYLIWFDNILVSNTTAVDNSVNATFNVPTVPKGNYTITLQDFEKNLNATTWFYVETAYHIEAVTTFAPPKQLQENSSLTIRVNVTGGESDKVYYANVTVKPPSPRNETYWTLIPLSNTTNTGNGYATLIYPSDFSGTPDTNFVGTYTVAFNKTTTATLASDTFIVGLTNATEYHRNQAVDIKAAGYHSNESVTIKVTSGGKTIAPIVNVNATEEGLVSANWIVPSNASIGTYTVNITSTWSPANATKKIPADVQSFSVPGFGINMTTQNLAGGIVQNVAIKVFENSKSVANRTTGVNGLATVTLEIGNYTFQAFYKGEKVYEKTLSINNATSLIFNCTLTNLKIFVYAVKNGINIKVPEALIYLSQENKTFTTDINGTVTAYSLLPNTSYTLNVSRYGVSFNVTNLPNLLINGQAVAWYEMPFFCPARVLQVNVTNADGTMPFGNAKVEVLEFLGGLLYEGDTNAEGIAIFTECAFGKYVIKVYDADGVKVNETTVNLFQNQNVTMRCKLLGLTVSVKIVDYFGQPISNVKVVLQREGVAFKPPQYTLSDGTATFNNVTGGTLQVAVYLFDQTQPYMRTVFSADSATTTVGVKLGEYITIAGFLVETTSLIITIIIVASVIAILLIELYRRKHLKPQTSPS